MALCLALAACTSTPNETRADFSWLEGCWRSSERSIIWRREGNERRWIGEVEFEHAPCADQPMLGGCQYIIATDSDGVVIFTDAVTDHVQTYALENAVQRSARFRWQWSPHRPPPMRWLDVGAEDGRLRMALTSGDVLFDGERC